jgi:hypothetical protein
MSQNRAGTESEPVLEIRVEVVPSSTECEMLQPCYNPVTSISTAVQRCGRAGLELLRRASRAPAPSQHRRNSRGVLRKTVRLMSVILAPVSRIQDSRIMYGKAQRHYGRRMHTTFVVHDRIARSSSLKLSPLVSWIVGRLSGGVLGVRRD